MRVLYLSLFIFSCFFFSKTKAQDLNQSNQQEADSIQASSTSLSAFSELALRINFLNRALSYGRDFGINQSAMTATATYFHKSGVFASAAGYWYSEATPSYSLTLLSLGYNGDFTDDWSYAVGYDRYIFNPTADGIISNGLNAYTNYDFGHLNIGANFGYLFGEEKAYNASISLSGFWKIKNVGFIDKITFTPSLSAALGTESVPLGRFTPAQFERANQRPWVQRKLANRNPNRPLPQVQATEKQVFGLMAWNFAVPVRLTEGMFRLGIAWNYVIPVKLPEEDYTDFTPSAFFNFSLAYTIR
jgi:hypothetical protein